jgi:hypothetical protein
MNYVIALIPIWLILLAGLIVLQIFLSRAKSKIPGLIIPIFFFTSSLLVVALLVLGMKAPENSNNIVGMILPAISGIFTANIPTALHLLIYFLVRKKLNIESNQEIKKMTIQDLE